MTFDTHPKFDKSKKTSITIDGIRHVVRKVDGKHISKEMEAKERLERACKKALAKYGY